jgi:hypothetical protein
MAKRKALKKSEVEAHRRMYGATGKGTQPPRLISNGAVLMAKPTENANNDLPNDVAEAVGRTIGNIVNEIEQLDSRKAELLKKLSDARDALNEQFNRWLPAALDQVADKAKAAAKKLTNPCSICKFKTEPYHDARLKAHRDQVEKRPLTDEELAASKLRRLG